MKNNEEGITLIALIITIIVMLILAGVTINVALNGGLFEKAKNAKELTQKEVEREELVATAVRLYNAYTGITQSELVAELSKLNNEYTVDNDKTVVNSNYVISGPSGTIWKINLSTAEVKEYEEIAGETWYNIEIINPDEINWEQFDLDTESFYALFFENKSGVVSALVIETSDDENNVFKSARYTSDINEDSYYTWEDEDDDDETDWTGCKDENDKYDIKGSITIEKVKFTTVTDEDWNWLESFPEGKIDQILTRTVTQ